MEKINKAKVQRRIELLENEIEDINILSEILTALKERIEPLIFSKISGPDGKKVLAPLKNIPIEELRLRLEYIDCTVRMYDVFWELESKETLLDNYKKHVEHSVKEGVRPVSDKEIMEQINKLQNMNLSGKDKQRADQMIANFISGNVVGLSPRFNYLNGIKNFIDQLQGIN